MQEPFLNPLAVVDIHTSMDSHSSQMSGSGQIHTSAKTKQSGKEEPETLELYDLFVSSRSTDSRPVAQDTESTTVDAVDAIDTIDSIDSPESMNSMPAFFVERRADSAPLLLNEEEVYESAQIAYDSNQSENMPLVFDPGDLLPLAAATVRFQSFLPEETPMTCIDKESDNAGKNRSPIWTNSIDPFDPAL